MAVEITSQDAETTIDPLNDYFLMVDVSETPDALDKVLMRYVRQVEIVAACSDEATSITTGTAKCAFRMPFPMTLTAVRANVNTAPTGSTIIIDINEGAGAGTTILSTKLSIDASEFTSVDAASQAVISDTSLADDARITIDFDQVGSTIPGAGVKVALIGYRT